MGPALLPRFYLEFKVPRMERPEEDFPEPIHPWEMGPTLSGSAFFSQALGSVVLFPGSINPAQPQSWLEMLRQ